MLVDLHSLATAVKDSIAQYQSILEFILYMNRELDRDSEVQLQGMAERLRELQEQAIVLDGLFLLNLNKEWVVCEDLRPLLEKREEVIREILCQNNEVRKKAQSAQSLLAHELSALRHGQMAMSGYKSQQIKGGRIVNSTL